MCVCQCLVHAPSLSPSLSPTSYVCLNVDLTLLKHTVSCTKERRHSRQCWKRGGTKEKERPHSSVGFECFHRTDVARRTVFVFGTRLIKSLFVSLALQLCFTCALTLLSYRVYLVFVNVWLCLKLYSTTIHHTVLVCCLLR